MGSTTRDLFGDAAGAQPATPGSYGMAPQGHRLPGEARLGPVHLQVADLERSLTFYEATLSLRVLERGASRVSLAAHGDDRVLVELHERTGTRATGPHSRLGLYHFALLLPDRGSLGRFVRHLSERGVRAGAADHLVSEAFYLRDPDGLQIEVYADRPRRSWRRKGRELMVSTEPIDLDDLLREAGDAPWRGVPAGSVIGHVHLHVGSVEEAGAFYSETLGFDRNTWSYPGALFLGAGGYHHHLGTNSWAGPHAKPPEADEAKLLEWTIELPDRASLEAARRSLAEAGHPIEPASDAGPSAASETRADVHPGRDRHAPVGRGPVPETAVGEGPETAAGEGPETAAGASPETAVGTDPEVAGGVDSRSAGGTAARSTAEADPDSAPEDAFDEAAWILPNPGAGGALEPAPTAGFVTRDPWGTRVRLRVTEKMDEGP